MRGVFMRVSKIQLINAQNNNLRKIKQPDYPAKKIQKFNQISFKGTGKGLLTGLGVGLTGSLLLVCGLAMAGTLVLPAALGSAVVFASGVGCSYVGDKLEDKINGNKNS